MYVYIRDWILKHHPYGCIWQIFCVNVLINDINLFSSLYITRKSLKYFIKCFRGGSKIWKLSWKGWRPKNIIVPIYSFTDKLNCLMNTTIVLLELLTALLEFMSKGCGEGKEGTYPLWICPFICMLVKVQVRSYKN